MSRRRPLGVLVAVVSFVAFTMPAQGAALASHGGVRTQAVDVGRRIDVNRINLIVANDGLLGYDRGALGLRFEGGLFYPQGDTRTLLYASGLWLGGIVNGETRVTVAEYSTEYGPGTMTGGIADDPAKPEYRVYKVARWSGTPLDSAHVERSAAERAADPAADSLVHHSWSEYMAGAAPHGAPWRLHRLPNAATPDPSDSLDVPGPDVLGDQMLWCVYNDADPALHTSDAGRSAPLGVEVRQTVFAYDRPGPLGDAVFVRYEIRNRGSNTITEMRLSQWADTEIGGFADDFVGCDPLRSLGFGYNATNADYMYGAAVPALGFDLLSEHDSAVLGRRTGMDAFTKIWKGLEPMSPEESFAYMQGLDVQGAPVTDPTTGQTTTFMLSGDPTTGSGWLDVAPADRRLACSSGPWSLAPGDSLTFWVAIVVGQGTTRLNSVAALFCADDYAQEVFDSGFAEPFTAPPVCSLLPIDCPRSASWWAAQAASGGAFGGAGWLALSRWVDSTSVIFGFADTTSSAAYRAALAAAAWTARDSAKREYLALLSNVGAGQLGLSADGERVALAPTTAVSLPPLSGGPYGTVSVAEAVSDRPDSLRAYDGVYVNDVTEHRRALEGINVGLPFFGGGAGTGWDFFGGTLDPAVARDSFANVELRFSHTATQKAYRFLRLEQAGGSPPSVGRRYDFGGFHTVNLQAWDIDHGEPLDLAFVERVVTAADGTWLPSAQQPASLDSTWAPTDDDLGGREYLFVLKRPYGDTPKPFVARDGAIADDTLPLLYALWARLRAPTDVVDDGDAFRFVVGYPPTPSAERLLQWLEARPLDADSVARQYRTFAAAAADVNQGIGLDLVCGDDARVPATLLEASVGIDFTVTLRWLLREPATFARVELRDPQYGVWMDAAPARVEGNVVTARFQDHRFWDGGRMALRLAVAAPVGVARTDSAWVRLPTDPSLLSLAGVWPNPSGDGHPRIAFSLPSAGRVRLEVFDVAGRRVTSREIHGLQAGTHLLEIAPGRPLRPGIHFVRLVFGAQRLHARLVVL